MSKQVAVNFIECVGHGICAELLPERITRRLGVPRHRPQTAAAQPREARPTRRRCVPDARAAPARRDLGSQARVL